MILLDITLPEARFLSAWQSKCERYHALTEHVGLSGAVYLNGWCKSGFANRGFYQGLCHLAALAALGGDPQLALDISKGAGTTGDGFLDLVISYSFAEADIHRACAVWKLLMG